MTPCETCGSESPVAVVSVPGVPYSAAYCAACLEADAHPWGILVINTAMCGGLDKMIDDWRRMVENTCARLGRTIEQFEADVKKDMERLENMPPP